MHTDAQLDEILARAGRLCRCDAAECVAEMVQVGDRDVPALVAEVQRMHKGLRVLAEMQDGQEVVSAHDLRVSGDGSHVVHGPAFTAVHEEDLAARVDQLMSGT